MSTGTLKIYFVKDVRDPAFGLKMKRIVPNCSYGTIPKEYMIKGELCLFCVADDLAVSV